MNELKRVEEKFKVHMNEGGKIGPSGFEEKLFELILVADFNNLDKLNQVYPDYVRVVCEYKGIYDKVK